MPYELNCTGLVIQAQSGFFTIATEQGTFVCVLRGKLKRGKAEGDLVALGDRVEIQIQQDGSGVIEAVHERSRAIVRLDPRPRGVYRQVLLANADQAVFVFACAHPEPRLRMLDRFLVVAEKQGVPPLIVANKVDLVTREQANERFSRYAPAGYPVLYTSVTTGAGVKDLAECLAGKVSVLAGPSGVGKSSLLNAIQPGLGIAVKEIGVVNKGQHTTVVRQLYPLGNGAYVADTPGWRSLALWDTEPEEIGPLVSQCKFNNCSHTREPGCAVRAAVDGGRLHHERYESYVRLRLGKD